MEKRTPNDADDAGPLGQHHQHHWGPVSPFYQVSRLPVPTAPGLLLDVATMEAIMSPREFHGGFAMGILMDGVMGCRTSGGFMQVFCVFLLFVMMSFFGFACGFSRPPLAHPAIM